MKLKEFFKEIKLKLKTAGKGESEAEIIFLEVLGVNRASFYLLENINNKQKRKINVIIKKRKKNIPLNLILKREHFYGRIFKTHKKVLKPRSDSEILAREVILRANKNSKVLDLCSGSGIIGITANLETQCKTLLADISRHALKLSKANAKLLGANIKFIKSDMFKNINGKFNIIACNPPYISEEEFKELMPEVKIYDPKLALVGGCDGLKFYKILASEAKKHLEKGGFLILEVGYNQADEVCNLLKENFECEKIKDFSGIHRVIVAKLKIEH